MNNLETLNPTTVPIISKAELLNHWQGHRALTRRVIELFPESEFFTFSIGGMRTFSQLVAELIAIGAPAMKGIINRAVEPFHEESKSFTTKSQFLAQWDLDTVEINKYWELLKEEEFNETFNLFGEYEFPIIQNILYFIDNEVHHRGQGYVYLRALNIEPPFFWER
ncbi:MAG: damage-inducible protein DinB [Pedobacter sp.]|nr:MAG: damage-inducible protein DinB [Pedobacter sp.]